MNQTDLPAASEHQSSRPGPSPWPLAIAGLLAVIAGPVAYMMLVETPWILTTGAPAFVLMILGVTLSFAAVRRRAKLGPILIAGLNTILLALFTYGFLFLSALPPSEKFAGLKSAPEFSLLDENETKVTLSEARASGPVLLVFYRGFW